MASFKKRENGNWQGTIYAGRLADGKQDFRYVTRVTLKECKAAAREIEQEIESGQLSNIPNMKLSAWVNQWLEINKGRLSPSTYALYRTYEKNHYKEIGHIKLGKLNEVILTKFMNDKLKTLSRASVKRIMSTLKKILFDAMKHKSPARDIKLPSAERVTYMLLTDKEVDKIHEDVKGTKDEPIILLAAWCGLRRGEIFALKWDDVNWTEGILRIDESRCVTSENTYIDKRPKSENGVRSVVVPEDLLALLLGLKKAQMKDLEKKKKKKKEKTSAVILEKELTGARIFDIRPDSWSSYFAELVKIKGWPPVRFHDLRHYHASWLYDKGIPDHYAAERLGHDVQILKSIYQHLQANRRTEIDSNLRQLHKNNSPQG